ncbi:M23 family metallopeptidase [bacterium]|nr:M23 family metallopeptidase [bacterium]
MKAKLEISVLLMLVVSFFACTQGSPQDNETSKDSVEVAPVVIEPQEPEQNKEYVFKRPVHNYPQDYFRNPIDSPVLLSGTFCELRTNHFHGGLDIRTLGMEGLSIKSIADGYVSRIKVSPYGYGKALYVTHPNGYTSVYGHLKNFSGEIAEYCEKAQYNQRTFEIELYPKAGELKVTKGQEIAKSGNTGGSGGPHLHFEIRNGKSEALNPLLFGLDVEDKLPPTITRVLVYKKDRESLVEYGTYPYERYTPSQIRTLKLEPGTYSFGMFAKDFFTDYRYKLGINYCWLTANGELLYNYSIDRMSFELGRYINTHMDPYLKYATGVNFVRLFKEDYNPYWYYKQDHNGEIFIKQGDTVNMKLYVMDLAGYKDSVIWTVIADTMGKRLRIGGSFPYDEAPLIKDGTTGKVSRGPWSISIPDACFYHDFKLRLKDKPRRANMLSDGLQIHYGYTPLHTYYDVTYQLDPSWVKLYGDKLCAVSFGGGGMSYEGGTVSGNTLSFRTRSFDEFAIYYDKTPPRIRPFSLGRNFRIGVSDNLSGIERYICSVDDQWVLMEYEPKASTMFGRFPDWIKPGKHELKIVVIDSKGNRAELKRDIYL